MSADFATVAGACLRLSLNASLGAFAIRERCGALRPQACYLARPHGAARHSSSATVSGCRHLSTIFLTAPPLIHSSRQLLASRCPWNWLILQAIFDTAPDGFRVGTRIALNPTSAGYVAPSEVPNPCKGIRR